MIRAGRTAVDAADLAKLHGITSVVTARKKGLYSDPTLPAPISATRKRLWDRDQAAAHAAGEPIPELPAEDDPDDLLEAQEAAALWEITPKRWLKNVAEDYAPPASAEVYGIPHWTRATVTGYRRPGAGAGAGRPRGARDSRPRARSIRDEQHHKRVRQVQEMVKAAAAEKRELKGPDVAVELGISRAQGRRLLDIALGLQAEGAATHR
ncbi:hypothetical protein [Planomonospora parontospora]|uniref:hypothetical protein n=1 Tax=Planomonospora parontospora TaxID=58119 RepID=UPI0016702A4D|nr:hypothetical protein [Planomonospora parontospora]GGL48167.1 hypothetical protein GCM10014719_56830 [Planomonospora parontospora subsp. antibiotica]GII18775.1 hypothetical protein Ppa05_55010 [Planomonospora parontospora subsp. antibiotica]